MAEEITAYRAKDGTVFEYKHQAVAHEKIMEFDDWYENQAGGLFGGDGSRVPAAELREWLLDYRVTIGSFYAVVKSA